MRTQLTRMFYRRYKPVLHRRIARELGPARRVVDIGCGDCTLATLLARVARQEVIGVDIADHRFPQPAGGVQRRCEKADARSLAFLGPESVDAVVSVWALHELSAPLRVLREARRILRPGGEILIVDFPRDSVAQKLWNEDYYRPDEVAGLLGQAGFAGIRSRLIEHQQVLWARAHQPLEATP